MKEKVKRYIMDDITVILINGHRGIEKNFF